LRERQHASLTTAETNRGWIALAFKDVEQL
jgi:hypothetical protein